ncbi:MAG: methyltransferase [Flavobacteriaceae bacterium]|nr:methyltransferase [Flavobacteriaceae bacterium]
MKVGTDGVLLGAWASSTDSNINILDIGTGTGLIAIMMAQRNNNALITGVEIELQAYNQALENIKNSQWDCRLEVCFSSIGDFKTMVKYDHIISNPPFYNSTYCSDDKNRNMARHTSSLSFSDLIKVTTNLLKKKGLCSFIIPYDQEGVFLEIAKENGLCLSRLCRVRGNENSIVKRSLIELSFVSKEVVLQELIIEKERHIYTQEYIALTKDFYIKM